MELRRVWLPVLLFVLSAATTGCSRGAALPSMPADLLDDLEKRVPLGSDKGVETRARVLQRIRTMPDSVALLARIWMEADNKEGRKGALRRLAVEGLSSDPSPEATHALCRLLREHEVPERLRWYFETIWEFDCEPRVTLYYAEGLLEALRSRPGEDVTAFLNEIGRNPNWCYRSDTPSKVRYVAVLRETRSQGLASDRAMAESLVARLEGASQRSRGSESVETRAVAKVLGDLGPEALSVVASHAVAANAANDTSRECLLYAALCLTGKKVKAGDPLLVTHLDLIQAALAKLDAMRSSDVLKPHHRSLLDDGLLAVAGAVSTSDPSRLPLLAARASAACVTNDPSQDYLLCMALWLLHRKLELGGLADEADKELLAKAMTRLETMRWKLEGGSANRLLAISLAQTSKKVSLPELAAQIAARTQKHDSWLAEEGKRIAEAGRADLERRRADMDQKLEVSRQQALQFAKAGNTNGLYQSLLELSDRHAVYPATKWLADAIENDPSLTRTLRRSTSSLYKLADTASSPAWAVYMLLARVNPDDLRAEAIRRLASRDDCQVLVACMVLEGVMMNPRPTESAKRSSVATQMRMVMGDNHEILFALMPLLHHRSLVIREYVKGMFDRADIPYFLRTPHQIAAAIEDKRKAVREAARKRPE